MHVRNMRRSVRKPLDGNSTALEILYKLPYASHLAILNWISVRWWVPHQCMASSISFGWRVQRRGAAINQNVGINFGRSTIRGARFRWGNLLFTQPQLCFYIHYCKVRPTVSCNSAEYWRYNPATKQWRSPSSVLLRPVSKAPSVSSADL